MIGAVRMTFQRMADRRPVETLVERDDGVVFAMRGAGGGGELPHDLVHAVVETALPLTDGIWGCVADGVVWGSMRHVSGRRPPHSAERSDRPKRARHDAVQRAENAADLVGPCSRLASAGCSSGRRRAVAGVAAGDEDDPPRVGRGAGPRLRWTACVEWRTTGSGTTTS